MNSVKGRVFHNNVSIISHHLCGHNLPKCNGGPNIVVMYTHHQYMNYFVLLCLHELHRLSHHGLVLQHKGVFVQILVLLQYVVRSQTPTPFAWFFFATMCIGDMDQLYKNACRQVTEIDDVLRFFLINVVMNKKHVSGNLLKLNSCNGCQDHLLILLGAFIFKVLGFYSNIDWQKRYVGGALVNHPKHVLGHIGWLNMSHPIEKLDQFTKLKIVCVDVHDQHTKGLTLGFFPIVSYNEALIYSNHLNPRSIWATAQNK